MLKSNTNIATVKRILNDFFLFILLSVKKSEKKHKNLCQNAVNRIIHFINRTKGNR